MVRHFFDGNPFRRAQSVAIGGEREYNWTVRRLQKDVQRDCLMVFLENLEFEGVTIMAKDLTVSYPVVITHDNTDVDYPYEVYIPAFEGYTQGRNMANAILMARDFIGLGLSAMDLREDGKALPHPGALPNKTQDDQTVMLVEVNVDDYQRRQDK